MNERVIELSLDLNCKTSGPVVHLTQFDKGVSIHLSAYLDGSFFSLSGTTVVLKGIDARKGQVLLECQVNADGTATATTLDSTFSEDGVAVCKFVISDSTKTYATQTFLVDVDNSMDAEMHDDRYSLLGEMIRKILLMDEQGGILVDEELDPTSKHPVQNKVIYEVLSHLAEYVTSATVDNATETGKVYYTTVGSSKALIVPVSGNTSQVQFRLDRDGKIYSRRRDKSNGEFPEWGSFADIAAGVDPDRETALDGIVSQEWEIGMRYLVNGVETWSGTSTSRMSTKPGTYIRFNKDDLIVMKKTMDYQFLVVYSTDNGSTWTSTSNRVLPYSILEDSIGWICIRKTSGTFTEEEMQSVVNNYFFILRKGTGEIKKNALLAEALSIASGSFDRSEIIDSKYGFTYQYVSQGATQAVSTELLLPEFSASAGDVFAIKASVSVDYPDMYSNIGVRIYERYNGNTVKATDITDISDTIIYTVSNSYTDAIHIRGLLLADEGDITISHYEIFDYKISVIKKLPGEIEELLTEAGDIWEV